MCMHCVDACSVLAGGAMAAGAQDEDSEAGEDFTYAARIARQTEPA